MKRILVSGITGFLGASIAESLLEKGMEVIGLRRNQSNLKRCESFRYKIQWVNIDENNWKSLLVKLTPKVFIHSAWIGVNNVSRNIWEDQLKNIDFSFNLLEAAREAGIEKFIGLGSQAEYGVFNNVVSENTQVKPETAYASVKVALSQLINTYCQQEKINFFWIRVFSVFGEGEDDNWLIPSLVRNIMTKESMDFTLCDQKYAYLYIKDFANAVVSVVESDFLPEGVYNLSSDQPVVLKKLITYIRDYLKPDFQLNFGKISYRENQSMHIEGDVKKIQAFIGKIETANFEKKLMSTVDFFVDLYNKEKNESV